MIILHRNDMLRLDIVSRVAVLWVVVEALRGEREQEKPRGRLRGGGAGGLEPRRENSELRRRAGPR